MQFQSSPHLIIAKRWQYLSRKTSKMNDNKLDFKLLKVKNGKPFFAIINLEVYRSDYENEVLEEYCGEGWLRQGDVESLPMKGYEDWKKGVKNGLEFAFSKSTTKWKVKIKKVVIKSFS